MRESALLQRGSRIQQDDKQRMKKVEADLRRETVMRGKQSADPDPIRFCPRSQILCRRLQMRLWLRRLRLHRVLVRGVFRTPRCAAAAATTFSDSELLFF